jgi:hypothetical protein
MSASVRAFCGLVILTALGFGNTARALPPAEAAECSRWLAAHVEPAEPKRHRGCVVAVAETYIDAEQNTLPFEDALLADDISRHHIGTEPVFAPGNRAKTIATTTHDVIAAIRNRRWTVEGDTAWILYDGYLKKDPDKIGFYVAERITLDKGLIREILVADITVPK